MKHTVTIMLTAFGMTVAAAMDADHPTSMTVGLPTYTSSGAASSSAAGSCDGEVAASFPGGWVDGVIRLGGR